MEVEEAKKILMKADYERQFVYKLSYQKNGNWKYIFFTDKEEAEMMIDTMMKINTKVETYKYISLNKFKWEMFIEP